MHNRLISQRIQNCLLIVSEFIPVIPRPHFPNGKAYPLPNHLNNTILAFENVIFIIPMTAMLDSSQKLVLHKTPRHPWLFQ